MLFALIILGITVGILLFLLILQKREIKKISDQLSEVKNQDTNLLIHSSGSGKTYTELINEINALLRNIQKVKIQYEQKNHAIEQMLTNISHDLRTPLTSAMGYIHIVQNSDITEEEKSRELAIIEKRLIRLEELINSFFEFSQIISSGKQPEKEELNIIAILEESIVHYYDDYCSKNRKIILNCNENRIMINSNKNMLLRIFDNLISNAFKHGIGDLTVSIDNGSSTSKIDDTDKAVELHIRFANELSEPDMDIEHIFDEFYTTDISRTKGNTGLGLAIVKQFAEMLGGTVSATNTDGHFELMLDLVI